MSYDNNFLRKSFASLKMLEDEELKRFIKEVSEYVKEVYSVNSTVSFSSLEGNSIARNYKSMTSDGSNSYIIYFDLDKINKKSGLISQSSKSLSDLLHLTHTIVHEIIHTVQAECCKESIPKSNEDIIIAKESLYQSLQEYYWDKLPSEFDAEIKGWKATLELLSKYSETEYRRYRDSINKQIQELEEKSKDAQITINIDGKLETLPSRQVITIAASEQIYKDPKLLKHVPILRYVYNEDGTRKNYSTLMSEKEERLKGITDPKEREKIERLYNEIINSDRGLVIQRNKAESFERKTEEEIGKSNKKSTLYRPIISENVRKKVINRQNKKELIDAKMKAILYQEELERQQYTEEENIGISL